MFLIIKSKFVLLCRKVLSQGDTYIKRNHLVLHLHVVKINQLVKLIFVKWIDSTIHVVQNINLNDKIFLRIEKKAYTMSRFLKLRLCAAKSHVTIYNKFFM